MQWGDTIFTDDNVSEFVGNLYVLSASASDEDPASSAVNARNFDLQRLYSMCAAATTSAERIQIGQELQQET